MTYNRPETIYYREAKKLLSSGMKLMSKVRRNERGGVWERERRECMILLQCVRCLELKYRYFHICIELCIIDHFKFVTQEKLINMKRTLPFLASMTYAELGVEEPDETTALMAAIVEEERQEKERAKEREESVVSMFYL